MSMFSMFGFFRLALGILITGLCCRVVLAVTGLKNSFIVGNNLQYLSKLTNWINPRRSESDWELCWRASRDDWHNNKFHSLCDEKGPTITIVTVGTYIFGGYTSLPWRKSAGSGCFSQYDPQAFLFSLVNKPGWAPVKFNQTGEHSSYPSHSTYSCYNGPVFGGPTHDLKLAKDGSHDSLSSNLGYTYSPPSPHRYASTFARTFLAGSYQFNPAEIETFYDKAFTSQASPRTINPSYTASTSASPSLSPSVSASAAVSPSTSPSVSASVPILSSDPSCIATIYSNPFIERVVVPHQVACFTGADNLEEELGDFAEEINSETDAFDVVEKCAKLAHGKHYKMFALGKNGVCLSGADTQNRYYINGTKDAECEDGIGKGDSMFVYSLDHLPDLKPVGCYHEEKNDRALPDHYANFRKPPEIDWTQLDETIHQCGQVAYNKGYHYFAVQDYGECYSGNNASATYAKHGESKDGCYWIDKNLGFGVGMENASFVYRIN